jgi:hypothetical protein
MSKDVCMILDQFLFDVEEICRINKEYFMVAILSNGGCPVLRIGGCGFYRLPNVPMTLSIDKGL